MIEAIRDTSDSAAVKQYLQFNENPLISRETNLSFIWEKLNKEYLRLP